jgi:flagellar hook-associated protein 2
MGTLSSRSTFANVINEGQNAIYTIDGMTVSSQSNSDDKTINGTVFTLKKVTDTLSTPVKVSLELDKDAIVGNITALIDEFNALLSFIDENSKATVKEDTDKTTGQKTSKREVGCFTGDSNISGLRDNLKRMMTGIIDELAGTQKKSDGTPENGYSTLYSSASRLGITTQKDGTLSVDKDKLTKAITADFEGVRRLFTANNFSDTAGFSVGNFNKNSTTGVYEIDAATGFVTLKGQRVNSTQTENIITLENGISFEMPAGATGTAKVTFVRGIASQIANFVEKAKSTVDGYFKQSEKTYQARIDTIQKRVDELQVRVDNYNARISKQFAALERNMSNLQSQTANMMSALSTVSYKR